MVRPELADVSDDDLAERSRSGDREAFAGLYVRHFTGLYDFAARIVRDRDAAADVVQTTFTKAWTGLEGAGAVRNVKAWLYTIARNAAIDELRHRGREIVPQADDETPDVFAGVAAGPGSDPVAVAQDREVAELVWTSAAALGPQEYSLLDLHVRRDLGPDQLAEALGLSKGAVYTRLSRLRDSVEETVTSTLLLRRGRRECPELDRLLTKMGATELTRAVHAAIRSHRRDCDVCEESRRRFVSPMAILAGLAPVPAAAGLSDAIWERVSSSFDAPADGARPVSRHRVGRVFRRGRVLAPVLAAAVAASTAGVLALGSGPSPIRDPADVRSTTHEIDVPSPDRVVAMAWSRV
ncbi:MAG: RNA polymerase sigma factor, partial [Actinomycetota bacterium]